MGIAIIVLVVGILYALTQGGNANNNGPSSNQQGGNNSSMLPSAPPKVDPIAEQLKEMSLEEKVGQLVIVGTDGYEINENTQRLIQTYHVGGFILFQKNIRDTQQMLDLVNSLKKTNAINEVPLFLALDEEGGRVSRMPAELRRMPSSQKVGKQNDSDLATRVGVVLGQELKVFGMNVNFAPVLDIFSNPQNTVIGDRALGSTPELVSELGIQSMKGIQAQNIIPVVKHFPGHGDTTVDSHVGLPKVDYDLERLQSFELIPFSEAIAHDADAIMLAHILIPQLDPEYPASLSKTLISDILREDMKFEGVVFTDDMTMGAILENYEIGEAAVKSLQAGSDIVLICHDFVQEEAALQAILAAARTGVISSDRIDESVYRVLALKKKYGLSNQSVESVDVQGINAEITKLYEDYPALR
ncbi:beta-glucosidase-like glycosyl hydrolase [Desulfitobacterium dichloroeliminans LMG P-21439]|uniref:beta-N-acetylhexosaminidase n=1 Tax=Desulfitobacterium dichloroeliminans (strain LMG P-21439 / DCA1) TaxID=871963 RepID=L0F5D6_DESDL|nr:beta-glucosidase-like glycosyl hydrolase [Desulfitobacterium dichloroeliminans LMG P-21439]